MPKVSNMNVNATREVRVTFIRPLGTRLMWTHRYPTSRCLQSRGLCASAATAGLPIFCLIWLLLLVLLLALSFVIVPLQSSRPAHPTLGALAQLQCSSSPTMTLNLYYHSYTVRQYLPMTWSSIKPFDNNARVEVTEVGLLNSNKKCTIGISVNQ